MKDPRFDGPGTIARGYNHHAIRFTRWRDNHPRVGERMCEVYKVERHQQQQRQFMIARENLHGGGTWWHVYRRLNVNDRGTEWRWLAQWPSMEEAAAHIDDVLVGRTRIRVGGIPFKLVKARAHEVGAKKDPEPGQGG